MFQRLQNLPGTQAVPQLILLVAVTTSTAQALNSACTANGTSGRIECAFNVDIQKTKDNFVIQRVNDKHDATPDRVLSCVWTIVGLRCEVDDTYRFDYDVSSKVVVEIPKITKAHEGVYGCYGIPVENDQAKKCSLTIPGASEREEPIKSQTTLSTGKAVQNPLEEKLEKYILATGILSGILGAIVVLAVVIKVYKYWDGIINCIRAGVQGNGPATQSPAEGAPGRQTDERKENPPPAVEAKRPLLPQGHTDGLADNPPPSGLDQTSKQLISPERTDEDTSFVELKEHRAKYVPSPNGSLR